MDNSNEELILLERVFLRIGSAETDEQLENVLAKFLPPVLLKLSSPADGVRKKVMELLVHVNKRVKTRPMVKLPVEELLKQYQDPESSSFVINFTIIYLKLGYPRLSVEEQVRLVPIILSCLETKPQTHQDSLLLLIIPLLGNVEAPRDPKQNSLWLSFSNQPQISKHFLGLLMDMLLLPYGALSPQTEKSESDVSLPVPPGMSEYTFKRVTAENLLRPENLEQIKLGIVKFLANEVFTNEEILVHLVVAAADTRFSVANLADMELKKIVGLVDWSTSSLSLPLYILFLGSQTQTIKPNMKKSPASTRIRLKVLTYLSRVTGEGFVLPPAIQMIFDSLFGTNTNTRLKTLALNFTSNLVREANEEKLSKVANVIKAGLVKVTNESEPSHQGQAFVILGLLSRRFPSTAFHDVGLLELYFKKLQAAETELKLQIREGALNLITAFRHDALAAGEVDKNGRLGILFALLKCYVAAEEAMVRFLVVRCLAVFFPSNHAASKFLLLMASEDLKDEVANEAMKSLYGTSRKADIDMSDKEKPHGVAAVSMPSFDEMIKYIYTEMQIRLKDKTQVHTVGNHTLAFPVKVYLEILIYLRLCLINSLNVPLNRELIRHPCEHSPIIRKHIESLHKPAEGVENNALLQYTTLVQNILLANPSSDSISCMVELVGSVPDLHKLLIPHINWLRDLLGAVKEEIRENAAVLYSLVLNETDSPTFNSAIDHLMAQTQSKSLEAQSGAILGLGYCLERRIMEQAHQIETLSEVVTTIASFLSNANILLVSPACVSLGLIGRSASLPLENQDEDKGTESPDAKRLATNKITKLTLVNKLLDVMNNIKLTIKCRERAVRALGLICIGEDFPHTKQVMQGFLNTIKDTKDVEVHFTIGEALVMCVQGVWSPEARNFWTTSAEDFQPENRMQTEMSDDNLGWLVVELLRHAADLHPNAKQATSIWLLALLKSCVDRNPLKDRLEVLQNIFMGFLGENNDIVQNVASKALCLIYDHSKSEELLTALVDQLTSGRRQAVQVQSDTKLFEEGQLGKAPSGGNLTTYKELCSLASDLNKPDLIYQFMHLANHNAMWNSKKGAAYGFSSIAERCGEQLQQHLPKIIPKLYRYQYDPSPNLQASMQNIWHELVKEPQKMLDQYHNEVLAELLGNLNSNQYRVRQSCCLALQDFLKGAGNRSIHDSVHTMEELWTKLFRVMDDHHEQTRLAAAKTAKVLSKLCIKGCDLNNGKCAVGMMEAILPVLLNTGINSPVTEVRLISLQTISELVGSAGKQLKPFLPKLIPALLLATGELESTKLSYMSTMFGAQSQAQEVVDSMRVSMAKSHFTMDTVSKCLQYADPSILQELVPKVTELMKSSIGLGTRIVCAHFITLLTIQLRQDLQPYTGKFLAALVNGLTDRNSSIRKQYALAIGHLVSTAKESSLEKLFAKIKLWYFEREDDSIRSACAQTVQSISNQNPEVLKAHSDEVLPLVFFAMHANKNPETQNTLEIWNEVWAENSPGTESGIRQNIGPICDVLQKALESPSWTMKAQAANAVATVASKLGASLDQQYRNSLIRILLNGLSGRTWNGKDKLLFALVSICTNCKDVLNEDSEIDLNEVVNALLRESRKEEIVYKISALEALGNVLSTLKVDKFEEVYNIIESVLTKNSMGETEPEEDLSNEEIGTLRENRLKLTETVYGLLGKAWPKDSLATQAKYNRMFVQHCVKSLPATTRNVQVSIVVALCSYVEKLVLLDQNQQLSIEDEKSLQVIVNDVLSALKYSLSISKHTRLRKEALNVFAALGKRLKDANQTSEFEKTSNQFHNSLAEISSDNQPEVKSRVMDLKLLYKNV